MRAKGRLYSRMTRVGCEGDAYAAERRRARGAGHGLLIAYIVSIQFHDDDFAPLRRGGPPIRELYEGMHFSVHDAQMRITRHTETMIMAHTNGFC